MPRRFLKFLPVMLCFGGVVSGQNLAAQKPKDLPPVFLPTASRDAEPVYPWRKHIKATVFWVGERPTENNPVPNCKSSWDVAWKWNFGGFDDPDNRNRQGYRPKGFTPRLNPFYVALPYNDVQSYRSHKEEASRVIPWFDKAYTGPGKSVCKGRWVAIRFGGRTCYAQWEDCGPFSTDDWQYVFGTSRPATKGNGGAGIDLAPAVRDYLRMGTSAHVDWRFVEVEEVAAGPWRRWGENNHFVHLREMEADEMVRRVERFRLTEDPWLRAVPQAER